METTTTKVCNSCGLELPITEFYKNDRYKDGYTCTFRKCKCQKAKAKRLAAKQQQTTPPGYTPDPDLSDKSPRELQNEFRRIANELRARGFNCQVKLTYLQEIII